MNTTPRPDLTERLDAWGALAAGAGQSADAELLIGAAAEIRQLRAMAGIVPELVRLRAELERSRAEHRDTIRRFAETMAAFAERIAEPRP